MVDEADPELVEVDPDGELVTALCDSEATALVNHVRRSIKDLPDIPASVNPVNVVLCYEMFGLDDFSIAQAMNLTVGIVRSMRESEVYSTMKRNVIDGLIANARTTVQGVLSTHAHEAANKLVEETRTAGRATDRIQASKEILDRSGNTAKTVIDHKHTFDNELRINYVKQGREFEGASIEVDGL